jgi:RES domain-containing protein
MIAWRLTPTRHVGTALTGTGASLYGGRWNRRGTPAVYLATSLALATLEVVVHATGGLVPHIAIELELPDDQVDWFEAADLPHDWMHDETSTQHVGSSWLATGRLALAVPSVVVDARAAGERNLVVAPTHARWGQVVERQRFDVTIDARLT